MSILNDILKSAMTRALKSDKKSQVRFDGSYSRPNSAGSTQTHRRGPAVTSSKTIANLALLKSTRKIQDNLRKAY